MEEVGWCCAVDHKPVCFMKLLNFKFLILWLKQKTKIEAIKFSKQLEFVAMLKFISIDFSILLLL